VGARGWELRVMPYASDAQRRFFHSAGAAKAGISKDTVAEFDAASKGMDLPSRKRKLDAMKEIVDKSK